MHHIKTVRDTLAMKARIELFRMACSDKNERGKIIQEREYYLTSETKTKTTSHISGTFHRKAKFKPIYEMRRLRDAAKSIHGAFSLMIEWADTLRT